MMTSEKKEHIVTITNLIQRDNIMQEDEMLKKKLLEAFKFTADFLNNNNLTWWACGGTMLGAVRHHNIIPWDDDIDIMMPREDYNKLIQIKEKLKDTGYVLLTPNDEGYYLGSAKMCNWNTTIVEARSYRKAVGVYVDIFPHDRFNYDINEYKKRGKKYRKRLFAYTMAMTQFSFKEAIESIKDKHFGVLLYGLVSLLYPIKLQKFYRKRFLEVEQFFNEGSGEYMASPTGAYGTREFFKSKWFNETIEMPFSDFVVKVPSNYHEYLTVMYGDYMTLPPLEKRNSHHGMYYVNLERHYEWEELRAKGIL